MMIPVGVSNRHIHLSKEHMAALFGEGAELTVLKPLSQPGQFAAKETVTVEGSKGKIENVRVLGPVRSLTQLEISKTDSFKLGVVPPVRLSGDIEGTPGITIHGPNGTVTVDKGVIIAKRHIHMTPKDAETFGVRDKQVVKVKTQGERALIFDEVIVRVSEDFALDMHIDTDEANAAGLKTGDYVELLPS
ncbi:propanediol utilization protein [Geobacillus subterraneus]|uniref:Phosphate propanoyltransferase n=2 Tax=Geobacillus TaxID=129337 RepID=A0ABM6AD95_9BACL|nr:MULTISPECIES: phosphate propanoyltransferase [Geobacillus]AMX84259.1 propanediol utilization protein [Geobacillus subterraneus]KZS27151.1 propanediol utilization protein [Geobacillus subterraneus]